MPSDRKTERLNDFMAANEKIAIKLSIIKNINSSLKKHITALEKLQPRTEQYNRRNNMEVPGFLNDILDNDLEEKVFVICKDFDIVITSSDIEGCHCLSLGRNSNSERKQVIN